MKSGLNVNSWTAAAKGIQEYSNEGRKKIPDDKVYDHDRPRSKHPKVVQSEDKFLAIIS
jgi:hypothetical protein